MMPISSYFPLNINVVDLYLLFFPRTLLKQDPLPQLAGNFTAQQTTAVPNFLPEIACSITRGDYRSNPTRHSMSGRSGRLAVKVLVNKSEWENASG